MAAPDAPKPKTPPTPVHIGGETIVDRLLPHLKKIIVGALAIAAIATIIFGIRWWKHRGQEQATEQLAAALEVAQRPIAEPGAKPDPKRPAFASPAERAAAVLDALSKSGAAAPGRAYRGALLIEAGKIDEAITELRAGIAAPGIDGALAREALGTALETKALAAKDAAAREPLLKEALGVFQSMQPDPKGARHAYALYHQGRLRAQLGEAAEAKKLFEQANQLIEADRGHVLRELISKRLAALGAA
jgi:tetratricopeptide (TPR) repeat protein